MKEAQRERIRIPPFATKGGGRGDAMSSHA
jgi:hypothetical protein